MANKSEYICTTPFRYTEVHDKDQWLCCPSWLPVDVEQGLGIKGNFRSDKAEKVRDSILDGSYSNCDELQCPYLAELKNNKISSRFIPKTDKNIRVLKSEPGPHTVNFAFDRSCNYACPTCRLDFIMYKGEDRKLVEKKLKEVNEELAPFVKRLYLSGSADPFFSNSFRKFMINLPADKYKKLESMHLHTNGSLWTKELWDKMKSIHKFVNSCEISIDAATKHTYENETRVGGKWDIILERLKFITQIPTIKEYCFSFVTQDSNFREMEDYYKLIKTYFDKRKTPTKWEVKFNRVINWGTYDEESFKNKEVFKKEHPLFEEFMENLNTVKELPNVVHNFHELYETKNTLI